MKDLQTIVYSYFDEDEFQFNPEYADALSHDNHSDSYYEDTSR